MSFLKTSPKMYYLKHGIYPSFEDVESDKQVNDALLNVVKIKASAYRNEVVEQTDHKESPDVVESKLSEDLMDHLAGMLDICKDTLAYSKGESVDVPICADNTEIEIKEEVAAAEPLMVIDQKVVINKVEQKIEKSEPVPTFDFRGKQKAVNPIKEMSKAAEVKATEVAARGKPKFDFRNRRSSVCGWTMHLT